MNSVVSTIVPVFGLIALGFLAGRTRYVGEAAIKGLPEFVFRIAMPIMLFRTIGRATMPDLPPGRILAAFFGAALVTWLLSALAARLFGRTQADASAWGIGSTFANSVMLGIPICLAHFGPAAAPYLALIVLCDTAGLWLLATLHLGASDREARNSGIGGMLGALVKRLLTNPVIVGCAAGFIWQRTGVALPALADQMVTMLANAAIPGALVAMGLALNSYGLAGQVGAVTVLTALKLLVMPAVAYGLGTFVLDLPPLAVAVVTVLAAMPVGANAYLFAAAYGRQEAAVSGAIALSTPLALITLSALLLVLPGQP
jgi:malonate transporter and related proteins